MIIITLLMTIVILVVTILSCVSDVRSLRIPNWHSLVILACFVPAWLAAPTAFGAIWGHVGAMVCLLALTYAMFTFGMMGGGDSKLGTALGLWVGPQGLIFFMLYMAVMGGVMGLFSLVLRKNKPFKNPHPGSWVEQAQNGRNAVPYGVAITVGSWAAFFHTGFLYNQLNELIKIIH